MLCRKLGSLIRRKGSKMCVVSMVTDYYRDKWTSSQAPSWTITWPLISRQEFDQLQKEVQEMKELLTRAKKYDEDNNEPHCEKEENVKLVKRIAELVGVDLGDLLG